MPSPTQSRLPTLSRRSPRRSPGSSRSSRSSKPAGDIDDLGDSSQSAFLGMRGLLEQRGRQGWVRRCHGDLHVANIVLIGHKPAWFDAIEFAPPTASVDGLYYLPSRLWIS